MTLDELSIAFYEARKGNKESLDYLANYFISNTSRQLSNIGLKGDNYYKKLGQAYQVFLTNLNTCYEAESFINKTLEELKKVVYLDEPTIGNSSRDILKEQESNIRNTIMNGDLDKINLPIVYREVARMYCYEQKSIKELSQIFKCSETIIYSRLRKVGDAILKKDRERIKR